MGPLVCDACHTVTFTDVPFVSITWTSWFTGAKGAVSRTKDNSENRRLFSHLHRETGNSIDCYGAILMLFYCIGSILSGEILRIIICCISSSSMFSAPFNYFMWLVVLSNISCSSNYRIFFQWDHLPPRPTTKKWGLPIPLTLFINDND